MELKKTKTQKWAKDIRLEEPEAEYMHLMEVPGIFILKE